MSTVVVGCSIERKPVTVDTVAPSKISKYKLLFLLCLPPAFHGLRAVRRVLARRIAALGNWIFIAKPQNTTPRQGEYAAQARESRGQATKCADLAK